MPKFSSSSVTRTLSGASYSLVISGQRRGRWLLPVLALLISGAVYVLWPAHQSPEAALQVSIDELKRDNFRLNDELKQQGMNFQHEQATREALERQLATQGEELKKARKDLSFYRGNTVSQGQ